MSADLDRAIDRAARQMLDVEPRADLRVRVVARIEALSIPSGQRPAAGLQWSGGLRFGVLVAAATALVLMVLLVRRTEPPAHSSVVAQMEPARPSSPLPNAQPSDRAAPPTTPAIASRARVPRRGAASVVAAPFAAPDSQPSDINPLEQIAPIEIAPIAPSRVTPEPIDIRPLNPITEMQIAPLNPPDRRD